LNIQGHPFQVTDIAVKQMSLESVSKAKECQWWVASGRQ